MLQSPKTSGRSRQGEPVPNDPRHRFNEHPIVTARWATRKLVADDVRRHPLQPIIPKNQTLRGTVPTAHSPEGTSIDDLILFACGAIGLVIGRPFKNLGCIMVMPFLLSATAHRTGLTEIAPPGRVFALAQAVISGIASPRFAGITWRELRTAFLQGMIWAFALIGTAILAAWACTSFLEASLTGLVLAFAPGGIVEITIVAHAIG